MCMLSFRYTGFCDINNIFVYCLSLFDILNIFLVMFLLVVERTQIHYTMYFEREQRPSASKLTTFLTVTSVQVGAGRERPRGMRPMS
jgi:hypothetical protein